MNGKIDQAISELLDGNVERISDESRALLHFLFEKEEGKKAFDNWFESHAADSSIDVSKVDFEKMYEHIASNIAVPKKSFKVNLFSIGLRKIAAVLAIPLIAGASAIFVHFFNEYDQLKDELEYLTSLDPRYSSPLKLEYASPAGTRTNILLPDSTEVSLNGNSRLVLSSLYGGQERRVRLIGEGFFNVAKDTSRQFIVEAEDVDVVALGTSFYVKAYPDENMVEAVLVSGRVSIATPSQTKADKPVVLVPNQKYTYYKEINAAHVNKSVKVKKYEVWKDGELIFEDELLIQIINRLEHFYNVKFEVKDNELYSYRFTASLDNCSLEQILEYIKLSSPMDYSIDQDIVTLKSIQ